MDHSVSKNQIRLEQFICIQSISEDNDGAIYKNILFNKPEKCFILKKFFCDNAKQHKNSKKECNTKFA